jgi:dihydroflavonol-4-reductase
MASISFRSIFLASNIIVELLSNGYAVRGVLRNLKNLSYLSHPNRELVQGDFTEEKFI